MRTNKSSYLFSLLIAKSRIEAGLSSCSYLLFRRLYVTKEKWKALGLKMGRRKERIWRIESFEVLEGRPVSGREYASHVAMIRTVYKSQEKKYIIN